MKMNQSTADSEFAAFRLDVGETYRSNDRISRVVVRLFDGATEVSLDFRSPFEQSQQEKRGSLGLNDRPYLGNATFDDLDELVRNSVEYNTGVHSGKAELFEGDDLVKTVTFGSEYI
jgi:hypothetical protein